MRSTPMLAIASALVATTAGSKAPEVTGNPTNVTYKAEIATPNENGVIGTVAIYAEIPRSSNEVRNGTTVEYIFKLPEEGGPSTLSIHVNPVNSSGSCASTGACQIGDFSGKSGNKLYEYTAEEYNYYIAMDNLRQAHDPFISLVGGTPAFIGNRSIVVQAANKSRIACANFVLVTGSGRNGTGAILPTVTPTATPTATPTGAAAIDSASMLGLLGVLAVGAALL
ncbi:hypothetical protein V493_02964 [Pseudogymnoascus sp. VKM F-4281 (FW-2241)]|nr:hypothetical protein V493_02964 [Pseudogymnoascus sp. VKM F-4281 (FW-2241)]